MTGAVIDTPVRIEELPGGATVEVRIDPSLGCRNLEQRVVVLPPGVRAEFAHADSEDVLYVLGGSGRLVAGDRHVLLEPGTGIVVPAATRFRIEANSDGLRLLSVLSPQPGRPGTVAASSTVGPALTPVRAEEQEIIAAGDDASIDYMDRWFRVLADPGTGARYVTQFIGSIARSRAPEHTHTYEEVIYIIGGTGIVHVGGSHPLRPGTSVYLPPGSPHCLENPNDDTTLELLGVFCPAGSPKERRPAAT